MLVGYARASKADGSQSLDLQTDALTAADVQPGSICSDLASGKVDARPGLGSCLKALRSGDTLVVWKLDRPGRSLRHLINTVHDLTERGIGGRPYTMTPAKVRLAAAAMSQRDTSASALCAELGISRQNLYRYVSPTGQLRPDAETLLAKAETGR